MKDSIKVSILIPCYNSERFIDDTLQSCIQQQYPNIEIIIVDDGSTDKSVEIARKWANKFNNIHLYLQSNSGVCRARNLAFEKSTGDYIMYLDADDLISPDLISSQIKLLEKNIDNVIVTSSWGRFYTSIEDFRLEQQPVYKNYNTSIELIEDLLNGSMFGLTCYLTPRSIINNAGIWNEKLTINTDGEFFIRVLANANIIKFSPHGKLYYRSNNPNSISKRRPTESKGNSLLMSYKSILNYLEGKNMLTDRVKIGLKKSFQSIAYQYISYDSIVNEARKQAAILHIKKTIPNIGGFTFKLICHFIGFWNALYIKKLLYQQK